MEPYDVLKKPLITEKSTSLLQENKYTFEVDPRANKTEISRRCRASSRLR